MLSMKQRVFRIIAVILAVVLLIGAIPLSAFLISKFLKDDKNKGPVSLSVSNNSELITKANNLANGVNVRYNNSSRTDLIISNQQVNVQYSLTGEDARQVDSITTTSGLEYISNTMDMYIKTADGSTYYSSKSREPVSMNLYRYGYYYYDVRLEGQDFIDLDSVLSSPNTYYENIQINYRHCNDMVGTEIAGEDGEFLGVTYKVEDGLDPYMYNRNINLDASRYEYIKLTITAPKKAQETINAQMFIIAGSETDFNPNQLYDFKIIADGEEHDYYLPLHVLNDYNGTLRGVRFDFSATYGDQFTVTGIKAVSTGVEGLKSIKMSRNFNVYSNKINHVAQIVTTKDVTGIKSIGMQTKIDASKVNKIVVKDIVDNHYGFNNVQWETVEFVGFDIKDVGVFGYIMPNHATSGKINVELKDGCYIITQERAPANNKLHAVDSVYGNSRDFYIGQRIYTDTTHSFQGLMDEAYEERNPIPDNHIKVDTANSTEAKYIGYDALRGCYTFSLQSLTFGEAFHIYPNRHCNVSFSIIGDDYYRDIYVLATSSSGELECAALLDSSNTMLPIPLEVCKAFGTDGDENLYYYKEKAYGETIFPMIINAHETNNINLLNLYQNWGNYPLKQLSSIQFSQPYYHLSTGVTETNCITNYSASRLPDHRAMSAPMWGNEPQHTSAGTHEFFSYKDSEGNSSGEEWLSNVINSYGPIYSDVSMSYLSYDGKIKITYNHIEMPQTDENRAYYTMTYEFLEDVTIDNVRDNLSFYTVKSNDPTGKYTQIGYLNTSNEFALTGPSATKVYIPLGNVVPYFSFFNMDNCTGLQGHPGSYCNLSFIIQDYTLNTTEVATSTGLVAINNADSLSLSLNIRNSATFKKGDSITMNAIVMPWGSQNSDYTNVDSNVRVVRRSLLNANRLKTTAGPNCEVIAHPFVPQVKSTNGVSAEFTLTNGVNNIAVRAYGFNNLNRPVVYEKVGDEWKIYELSSKNKPDGKGYSHDYDGYAVYYDADGTYSYSFIVPMETGKSRTFKIVVGQTYKLTADANGGTLDESPNWTVATNGSSATKVVVCGDTYGSIPTPMRDGYTFDGWYTSNLFNYKVIPQKSTITHIDNGILISNAISTSVGITPEQFLAYTGLKEGDSAVFSATVGGAVSGTAGMVAFRSKTSGEFVLKNYNEESTTFVIPEGFNSSNYYGLSFYGVADGEVSFTNIQVVRKITSTSYVREARDHTITAKWMANKYTATFNANGGTIAESADWALIESGARATMQATYDSSYTKIPTPTREGYIFDGWYKDVFDLAKASDKSNWASKEYWYLPVYVGAGNKVIISHDTDLGTGLGFYLVVGTTEAEKGLQLGTWIYHSDSSVNLRKKSITITATQDYIYLNYSGSFENLKQYVLEDHFTIWTQTTENSMIKTYWDHTLYAKWTPAYTATFDASGGIIADGDGWTVINSGAKATKLVGLDKTYGDIPTPTREGYIFDGWFIGETKIDANFIVSQTQHHTITAHWTEVK